MRVDEANNHTLHRYWDAWSGGKVLNICKLMDERW